MKMILRDKRGLSRLEAICITGISIIVILFIIWAIFQYKESMDRGDDALRVNTCESVARNNIANNGCVVDDCTGPRDSCQHRDSEGYTVGYYDATTHHIEETKMAGYNDSSNLSINGTTFEGDKKTMIIEVRGTDDEITMKWVEGDNN